MSVKVIERKFASGTTTLLLEIWQDGKRSYERLAHLKLEKPTTPIIREQNKHKKELAKKIAVERAKQMQSDDYGLQNDAAKKTLVLDWMQHYVNKYQLKDKRNMQGVLNRFRNFLAECEITNLKMKDLDERLTTEFRDYLLPLSSGEGAASYFTRFKKMVKAAYRAKLLVNNPATDVKVKNMGKAKKKDILTLDEIETLAATPIQSNEVKRAFLFSCLTGLRWIDVKSLIWKEINLKDETPYVSKRQSKTENEVRINLNETAITILGEPDDKEALVFDLPTANGANKTIKAWVKRAGIEKEITWHNARHSAGTNLAFNNVDVLTISKLLGHTSTKHTMRYVDASNEMKQDAVNKLNINLFKNEPA